MSPKSRLSKDDRDIQFCAKILSQMLKVTQSNFLDLTSHLEDVYTVKQTTPYLGLGTC